MQLPQIADWVPLRNSGRPLPPGAKWFGPVDAAEPIMITIRVRPGIGADTPADGAPPDVLRATTPRYTQSVAKDGADQRDLDKVQQFASDAGLEIIEVSPARRSLVLWGAASAISTAFRVQLAHYRYRGAVRRGQQGPVYLPRTIAHIVEEVSGLDDGFPESTFSPAVPRVPSPVALRHAAFAGIALLIGIALGIVMYGGRGSEPVAPPAAGSGVQPAAPRPSARPPQVTAPSPAAAAPQDLQLADLEAAGWRSLEAGRLRDAQDKFLRVLTLDPSRHESMRGLVAVRRKLAGDDPRVIREQVAVYQDAIKRGVASQEYYTLSALQVLVSAALTAAHEIEGQHPAALATASPSPQARASLAPSSASSPKPNSAQRAVPTAAKVPQPAAPSAKVQVEAPVPPAKQADKPSSPATARKPPVPNSPAPSAATPPATAAAPATPAPPSRPAQPAPAPASIPGASAPAAARPAAAPPAGPLYSFRVGPVADGNRASAITKQLSAAGFPQTQVSAQTEYRVVSEPLPRQAAQTLNGALGARGLHAAAEPSTGDTVQLLFGTFTSRKDADALAGRISAAGYDAWIRETTTYTLRVGPYPQSSMNTIAQIARAGAPEATVAADSVSSSPSSTASAPAAASAPAPAHAPAATPAAASAPAAAAPARAPVAAAPTAPAAPAPGAPTAPTPSPAPAATAASPSAGGLYTIRVGPVSNHDRASAIAKQLSDAGFPQTQVGAQQAFRVLSEPLPRQVAQTLSVTLAARGFHTIAEPLTGDAVQLVFGTFTAQKDADALAGRITAAGYDAWVRETTVYMLRVGPYPQASVNAIAQIVKGGAPDAPVAADPSSGP
jgi:cell division septation protein DedD